MTADEQQYNPFLNPDVDVNHIPEHDNELGLDEKWYLPVTGEMDGWYYLLSDGSIYQYHEPYGTGPTFIGRVDSRYHSWPNWLTRILPKTNPIFP